jgi:hypothetical protein
VTEEHPSTGPDAPPAGALDPKGLPPTPDSAPSPRPASTSPQSEGESTVQPGKDQPSGAGRGKFPRWLPWAAIAAVVVVGLGIALPLTLGGSSSSASSTPRSGTSSLPGQYYTRTVQDRHLAFITLAKTGNDFVGKLTLASASPNRVRVIRRRYVITVTATGSNLSVAVSPPIGALSNLTGTYTANSITVDVSVGHQIVLERGTDTAVRSLLTTERAVLLG